MLEGIVVSPAFRHLGIISVLAMMNVSTLSVLVLRMLSLRMSEVLMGFNTHVVVTGNKVSYKVVAVVCRRFKTNAYLNHEVAPPFIKSDTVISNVDYHRRLD